MCLYGFEWFSNLRFRLNLSNPCRRCYYINRWWWIWLGMLLVDKVSYISPYLLKTTRICTQRVLTRDPTLFTFLTQTVRTVTRWILSGATNIHKSTRLYHYIWYEKEIYEVSRGDNVIHNHSYTGGDLVVWLSATNGGLRCDSTWGMQKRDGCWRKSMEKYKLIIMRFPQYSLCPYGGIR